MMNGISKRLENEQFIRDTFFMVKHPLWSSSLGHLSSKQEMSGLTPTGGASFSVTKNLKEFKYFL